MLSNASWHRGGHGRQRGLSLVEMMVGVAVGLIVVAAAATLTSTQLGDNRRLLIETQLQQDLRASMDIITRELRRTGAQREAVALSGIWYPNATQVYANEFAVNAAADAATPVSSFPFSYQPGPGTSDFGFELVGSVLKSRIGGVWQELTDGNVLEVTAFTVAPRPGTLVKVPCPKPCADGTAGCWPTIGVREVDVSITGRARSDNAVVRTVSSTVRLRNDYLRFFDPLAQQVCPA